MKTECLKCGTVAITDPPALACPSCGAVYSKVQSLIASGKMVRPTKTAEQLQIEAQALEVARRRELDRAHEQEAAEQQAVRQAVLDGWATGNWSGVPEQIRSTERKRIVLTTAQSVPNRGIAQSLQIVGAECVYGMNILKDFLADVRDVVGGRSNTAQKVLRDARLAVLEDLRTEAFSIGADAVIAITFEFNEMGSVGKMLFATATGTAVKLNSFDGAVPR